MAVTVLAKKFLPLKGKSLFYGAIFVLLIVGILSICFSMRPSGEPTLNVDMGSVPDSADPMDYDLYRNQTFQSCIHLRLVSDYRGVGKFSPEVAAEWKFNPSKSVWTFRIVKSLRFSDGTKLSARAVYLSLKRVFFLLKNSKSKNEVLRSIQGLKNFSRMSDELSGLTVHGDSVTMKFLKPIPNLLDQISVGLFSIVSPDSYDADTGRWLPGKRLDVSGAGPYRVSSENTDHVELKLKDGYPEYLYKKTAFKIIRLSASKNKNERFDLSWGSSDSKELLEKGYQFYGTAFPAILYGYIFPWNQRRHPLSNPKYRKVIRRALARELRGQGMEATNSFFPATVPGISEPKKDFLPDESHRLPSLEVRFNDPGPKAPRKISMLVQALKKALEDVGYKPVGLRNVPFRLLWKNRNYNLPKYDLEIGLFRTEIRIEDLRNDIRLMFSPEGIGLPDVDGSIHNELMKSAFDPQAINQKLFDQGVIFPVAHENMGIWARKDLDLSDYNTLKALGELQWIGSK